MRPGSRGLVLRRGESRLHDRAHVTDLQLQRGRNVHLLLRVLRRADDVPRRVPADVSVRADLTMRDGRCHVRLRRRPVHVHRQRRDAAVRVRLVVSYCGHGPLAPQQIEPHASPPIGPAASHESFAPHALEPPHMQVPPTHFSPVPQHAVPQTGPSAHPPEGAQLAGFASTPPSTQARRVHATDPPSRQRHELHPSPAGNSSPSPYETPPCSHIGDEPCSSHATATTATSIARRITSSASP